MALEPDRHVHLVLEHEGNAASLLRAGSGQARITTRNGPMTCTTACTSC